MPNRIIKESICTSERVNRLSWFEEVLFYRLIVAVDDYGRYDGRTAIIKNRLFPLKDGLKYKDVSDALDGLAQAGLVEFYVDDGKPFLFLPSWDEHQTIRAKKSKYPSPPASKCMQMQADASKCPRNPIQSEYESNPNTNSTHTRGKYGWVKLSEEEYSRLVAEFGEPEVGRAIQYVDESAQTTGNKNRWKDWNLVVRKCIRECWGKNGKQSTISAPVASAVPPNEVERLKALFPDM